MGKQKQRSLSSKPSSPQSGEDVAGAYRPPFTVSPVAVGLVADISALLEHYRIRMQEPDALRLRRANKIRSIHSSLAIEGNRLTNEQVTAIFDGKPVAAPPRDIQEIKNAIETYDKVDTFDPFSVADLLRAHGMMMKALVDETGSFRRGGVGVLDGRTVIHLAPPADRVPTLMANLFAWLKHAPDHLLIRSCVFHYEFEFIHPFADGNGRTGRLWQSVILGRFNPLFLTLPVETMVHDNQSAYYDAISASTKQADSGIFIEFMLGMIKKAIESNILSPVGTINGTINGTIKQLIAGHPGIKATELAAATRVSLRTVNRQLKELKDAGAIEYRGAKKTGGWYLIEGK